ncbi:MAG TPA: hypothetical protein VGM56_29465 [Byssovorax sp.]|jgi:predicted nucleic-acid-binding Zn-ribbon protein
MKSTGTCPKCAARDVFVVDNVSQYIAQQQKPLVSFDAYTCAQCGYTEFHAGASLPELERLASASGMGVRRLTGTSPYR